MYEELFIQSEIRILATELRDPNHRYYIVKYALCENNDIRYEDAEILQKYLERLPVDLRFKILIGIITEYQILIRNLYKGVL